MERIEDVFSEIKRKLDRESGRYIYLLFACNTTGKTRLSKLFAERCEEEVLCYNSFMEDLFHWDNENIVLLFSQDSWLANLIETEGLDGQIVENFRKLTMSKIEPSFNFKEGSVTFKNFTGNKDIGENIKVSRGEESLFIWSVFYTILSTAIDALLETEDNRSTRSFDNLKYIVIDDPVSSMDDTRIITMSLDLIELLKKIKKEQDLKILITTHHCLFYNVMHHQKKSDWNQYNAFLVKAEDSTLNIKPHSSDSPFSYHITLLKEIRDAIKNHQIQKYHFNLFRALMEKTANFLGYKHWGALLDANEKKEKLIKLLNLYSHSSLSEIESKEIQTDELALFTETVNKFIEKFHWSCPEYE